MSEDPEQVSQPEQVKRRGRPKKQPVPDVEQPVKRPVGRPKKVKDPEEEEKVKRPRGRPKGSINKEAFEKKVEKAILYKQMLQEMVPVLMEKFDVTEEFIMGMIDDRKLKLF